MIAGVCKVKMEAINSMLIFKMGAKEIYFFYLKLSPFWSILISEVTGLFE